MNAYPRGRARFLVYSEKRGGVFWLRGRKFLNPIFLGMGFFKSLIRQIKIK